MNQGKKIISSRGFPSDADGADAAALALPSDDSSDMGISDAEVEVGGESESEAECRAFTLASAQHGSRIDRALADLVPEFSRSYLRQLIEAGEVVLNGITVRKASQSVKAGDQGSITLRATPQSQAFKPEMMDLNVVYEDEYLRVINKPAGLVVHPAPGNWSGTLLNGLLGSDPEAHFLPRAGIVHRLDKDTSGLMVVARKRTVMDALVKLIAAREMSRQYLAMAHRPWMGSRERTIDAPLGRDPRNRLRMAVVDLERSPGKVAQTTFRLLQNSELGCLVHCALHTGRTHQIRVHMNSIGHPLVADALYAGAAAAGMTRQALHAYRLAFEHPVTGESLVFKAPVPDDLAAGLQEWGLGYNLGQLEGGDEDEYEDENDEF